jgi:hypothetical protein
MHAARILGLGPAATRAAAGGGFTDQSAAAALADQPAFRGGPVTRSGLTLVLAALFLPPTAAAVHAGHDEAALKADYEWFVRDLDHRRVAEDYAKAVRNLRSEDRERQRVGLATLAATEEVAVIPWVVPLLDSRHPDVRLAAGLALARLVEALVLKRRDPAVGDRVVLKPRGPKDPDLRPLGWAVWQMLRQPDDGNTHAYAASMVRYLELPAFAGDLRGLLQSRHPAVRDAARAALEGLGLRAAPDPQAKE